jgi:hypothetical protein
MPNMPFLPDPFFSFAIRAARATESGFQRPRMRGAFNKPSFQQRMLVRQHRQQIDMIHLNKMI